MQGSRRAWGSAARHGRDGRDRKSARDSLEPPPECVGWAKRSVPTISGHQAIGGHGASAPLPTLRPSLIKQRPCHIVEQLFDFVSTRDKALLNTVAGDEMERPSYPVAFGHQLGRRRRGRRFP